MRNDEDRQQGNGETERERVCVCECWSIQMVASASIRKQRGNKKHIWHHFDSRHLWLISGLWWDTAKMEVLTVSVITAQTFQTTTDQKKGYLYHNASPHKTLWLQKVLEARNNDKLIWFFKCLNCHGEIEEGSQAAASWGGGGCIRARTEAGRRAVAHWVMRWRSVREWRVRKADPRRTVKVTAMTRPSNLKIYDHMVERHSTAREWRMVLNVAFPAFSSKVESQVCECASSSAENEIRPRSHS